MVKTGKISKFGKNYGLIPAKREQAIALGAIEISTILEVFPLKNVMLDTPKALDAALMYLAENENLNSTQVWMPQSNFKGSVLLLALRSRTKEWHFQITDDAYVSLDYVFESPFDMPFVHTLKCEPPYFYDMMSGRKKFDVRRGDRDFRIGDTIIQQEVINGHLTGNTCWVMIDYIFDCGNYGINPEFFILGVSLT